MTSELDRAMQLELAARVVHRLTSPKGLAEMRRLMVETRRGPASPSLETMSRDRKMEYFVDDDGVFGAEKPSDPTGETAIDYADAAADALNTTDRLLEDLWRICVDLADLADRWTPSGMPGTVDHEDGFEELWCQSCWRDDKTCTPITLRLSGKPYHKNMCRWCGDLRQALGMRAGSFPPLEFVRLHHQHQPVTKEMVTAYNASKKRRKRSKSSRKAA